MFTLESRLDRSAAGLSFVWLCFSPGEQLSESLVTCEWCIALMLMLPPEFLNLSVKIYFSPVIKSHWIIEASTWFKFKM